MTYEQALEAIKKSDKQLYAYALSYHGWYLFILDQSDDEFPEPVAYDIQLDEYRDAYGIPEQGRSHTGWWLSEIEPKREIGKWLAVGTPEIASMLAEWKPELQIPNYKAEEKPS